MLELVLVVVLVILVVLVVLVAVETKFAITSSDHLGCVTIQQNSDLFETRLWMNCSVSHKKKQHSSHFISPTHPTTNGGTQNGSSVETCTRCAHGFCHVLAPIRMLSRCLATKLLASELRRKSIKSALLFFALVGHAGSPWDWQGGNARFPSDLDQHQHQHQHHQQQQHLLYPPPPPSSSLPIVTAGDNATAWRGGDAELDCHTRNLGEYTVGGDGWGGAGRTGLPDVSYFRPEMENSAKKKDRFLGGKMKFF